MDPPPYPTHMHVTTHSVRLVLARLAKESLPLAMHALCKCLFFQDNTTVSRFLSITDTSDEVSLVLDEESVKAFPEGVLDVQEAVWRPIQICEGPLGFTECGIVSALSGPLSKQGISVFYISTWATDYVLVMEKDLERALEALREDFEVVHETA